MWTILSLQQQWHLGSEHHMSFTESSFPIFQPTVSAWIVKNMRKEMIILFKEKNRKVRLSKFNSMKTKFKEIGTRTELLAFICWFELCTQYSRSQFFPCSPKWLSNKHFNINYCYKLFPSFQYLLLEFKGFDMP